MENARARLVHFLDSFRKVARLRPANSARVLGVARPKNTEVVRLRSLRRGRLHLRHRLQVAGNFLAKLQRPGVTPEGTADQHRHRGQRILAIAGQRLLEHG